MSILKFENSIVDQFLLNLTGACNTDQRDKAYIKINTILGKLLDDSTIITTFGSGPLKTYLPESDIDITVLFSDKFFKGTKLSSSSNIGSGELTHLKQELEKCSEEFNISNITIINAAVKLIKLY